MTGRLSKEALTGELPEYYKELSRRLYKVLEGIGVSVEKRDLTAKLRTSDEILFTVSRNINRNNRCLRSITLTETCRKSFYVCGSSFEGTTTTGLSSDADYVTVSECHPVVTDISEAQHHCLCLLMVQDSQTPPGYVKLQWVDFGLPLFLSFVYPRPINTGYDRENRAVCIDNYDLEPGQVRHGPARSLPETESDFARDYVDALRCRKIPDCASEWFTRRRYYNWPTAEWIDKCKALGCFFVYVGHPNSEEKHLQWRISFSLQERFLITQFNSVQLKCYILMKIIKKEKIHKYVGEKSITSYHCKPCLLYLIENTPAEFWREENLLICFYTCLSKILRCVETMDCPNYFIPDENMFDGRLHGEMQKKLCIILRNLLSSDFQFLLNLETDDLGKKFKDAVQYGRFTSVVEFDKLSCAAQQTSSFLLHRNFMLEESLSSHSDPAVSGKHLNKLKVRLQNTEKVTEHTREQTLNALSPVCHYIDISLMSVLTTLAKSSNKSNAFKFQILTSEKWNTNTNSLKSDQFSSKLKQASLLYMMEFPAVSLDVLISLERRLRHQLSFCFCSGERDSVLRFSSEDVFSLENVAPKDLLYNCFIPCVVYLPAEKDLTPSAICYEMKRSLGFPDNNKKYWYNWAVVDGKILLYFLLYLNHRYFGMETNAASDVANIRWLIETDECLGHRETALNLLGWIYKERGRVDSAVECFRESLTIQPTHNAALLHMRDIESVFRVFLSSRYSRTGIPRTHLEP